LSCRAESGKPDTVNNRHGKPDHQSSQVEVDTSDGWKISIFRE